MQRLMITLTGKIQRNGRRFNDLLASGKTRPGCRLIWFEGRNVSLLPDGSAWMFAMTGLRVNGKTYRQLTATDISERWKLTAELNAQNDELMRRKEGLDEEIANVHALSRERERQRAKTRAHDILGARLTFMLSAIRGGQALDYAKLKDMSRRLPDDLSAAREEPSPRERLDTLKQAFADIGVEVMFDGELPGDEGTGRLAADIAREGVTNAVRHGLAARVDIRMDASDGFKIKITDNGRPLSGTVTEGGGIIGIREKVKRFNGAVDVAFGPQFILSVSLPEGHGIV
jgi:signal transduction histidine kinase